MTTVLAPLSSLLLAMSWQSESGFTYTLQTSLDLNEWVTLPFVIDGSGVEESHVIDIAEGPVFARIRYSADGDTNENGLPDTWEWQQFGYLDVDPNADPDGDSKSTYLEWLANTNPLDFYDDQLPVIRISSGQEWLVQAGQTSGQALSISVLHPSGEPWAHAPVILRSESGLAHLVHADADPVTETITLTEWTDELGRINPGINAIHIVAPDEPGSADRIQVEAGGAGAEFIVRSTGADFGLPPRELRQFAWESGETAYAWSGPVGEASRFIIQEQDRSGNWIQIAQLETANLPPPDPLTGLYTLILAQIQNP